MEPPVVRSRGRPRKRRNNDLQDGKDDAKSVLESCKRTLMSRPVALVGRYLLKEFKGSGKFIGKVVYYEEGLYRVVYEDGDSEDLESGEIRGLLIGDSYLDDGLSKRKKRLDELANRFNAKNTNVAGKNVTDTTENLDLFEASVPNKISSDHIIENDAGEVEADVDSSSDSFESVRFGDCDFEGESLLIPAPHFPPSSGTIGIQEQHVSHLLSVYGFLRSFSFRLFLFPFSLDDFVGSLNCCVANTLLDSIHVALMRALRRHLEVLSSDGLEIASKCLRHFNWSLLDSLTWPVYLVQYLTVMGHAKGLEWNGFYKHVLSNEYYSIPAGRKLMVLQILCDEVLESGELRAEIDTHEISEVGLDYDAGEVCQSENGPRRVHPRYPKTSACMDGKAMEIIVESHGMQSDTDQNILGSKGGTNGDLDAAVDSNRNSDECRLCGMDGSLLCCDGCPSAYHLRCIGMLKILIPQGPWYCPECSINKTEPAITKGSSLRGAETFGIDPHEHIFLGSCNHLVVLKTSINSEPLLKYYNQNDILNVLHVLCSSSQYIGIYYGICKAIMQYWDIPENLFVLPEASGMDVLPAELRRDTDFYALSLPAGEEEHKELYVLEDRKDLATCKSENDSKVVPYFGTRDPPVHPTNGFIVDSLTSNHSVSQSQNGLLGHGKVKGDIKSAICCAYMGSRYKPQGYVNHYVHGEFAASAAHKLDVLSSEETRVLGTHASDSKRSSSASAYALLQAKAFSLSASRFIWPTFDKKLMEVPRERCGWCLSCRAAVLSKRGCLLNHAQLTATRGAMKILSSLRLGKNGEGNLSCIAVYILYMEESLRGLVGGTFLNASYRKQWHRQLESALSCSLIKLLLLELEENIRCIALSGNWFKLVDDWFLETSMIQSAPSAVGTTVQKRGPGRRGRKQSVSEVPSPDRSNANFIWFRGGLSKLVFQRAALPRCIVAKAARQGGSRKISGVHYTDGSEIPRRSRQLVWRAAVEASKNASQLALQLRNLDFHLRWNDLVRPEQTLDIKGQETEASIFRNARISDKKLVENKTTYGVAFGSQKHLPSRVMKNVIEIEQKQDGRVAYWFSENCIPLYLIKEYEEAYIQVNLLSPKVYQNLLYRSRSRWLKSYQRDIFFYLTCRRDNMGLLSCSSCRLEVLLRNAVKCSSCREYCHVNCTVRSTISGTEDVVFPIICKQCCHLKALNPSGNSTESPTSPLPLQDKEHRSSTTARKSARPKGSNQPLATPVNKPSATPVNKLDTRSEKKQVTPGSSAAPKSKRRNCSWGVIWKKKNCEDTGANFRHNFLLLKGGWELHHMKPICHLCSKPYRSDLMYICCETCNNWYHAEAVELEESKIFDVVGYKCCRCRRIKSPECPYMDPKPEKQEGAKKTRMKSSKQEIPGVLYVDLTISDSKKLETSSPLLPKEEEDPFVFSHSRVELITEPNSGLDDDWNIAAAGQVAAPAPALAPQKLPVRRQTKAEDDVDGFNESSLPSISIQHEMDAVSEWGSSAHGLEEEAVSFDFDSLNNYEDMDFGPQTYFSFTELLEPDDVEFGGMDLVDPSQDASGDVDNSLSIEDIDIFNHGSSIQQLEPAAVSIPAVKCQICTHLEPVPDLACQVCGLQIHSHCSPWDDAVTVEENWCCGRCREWQ